MVTRPLKATIIIGTIIATIIILDVPLMGYAEYLSWTYSPGRYDWIWQILASNPYIAVGVFVIVIGGLLSSLGYTIYKIFFKYKD